MRIAICEDNASDAERLMQLLQKLSGVSVTDRYSSTRELLDAYSQGKRYDLLFMDIQMPEMNGFLGAKILYNEYYEARPLTVFLTITDKYVFDAYNVGWDYICKPISEERMQVLFDRARSELAHRMVSLSTTDGTIQFRTREIIYIESFYGVVNVISTRQIHQTKSTLERVYDALPQHQFCMVHRSYIVNLAHVTTYARSEVCLSNGKVVPMSRGQEKLFLERHKSFLRGNCHGS